jgi:hypothetical protein
MKQILTLLFFLFLLKAGAQTSVTAVSCGQNNYFIRVTFTDDLVPVHDISTTVCADNSVHSDTEEGEFLKCNMELFADAACTQPISVDPRFFEFARDVQGSTGTINNPSIIYNNNCSATIPPGLVYGNNYRLDNILIYTQQCIWECSGSGYYNCYSTDPGWPANYNIMINCCFAPSSLAVHLVNFNGQRNAEVNRLSWSLDNKQDLVRLELERSFDGINYTVVYSTVNANVERYADVTSTTAYYRLRVFSLGGMAVTSSIILLKNLSFITESFSVSPSPFDKELKVSVSATVSSRSVFRLVSVDGKVLFQAEREVRIGVNQFVFNVPDLAPGVYIMTMSNGERMVGRKVVKR